MPGPTSSAMRAHSSSVGEWLFIAALAVSCVAAVPAGASAPLDSVRVLQAHARWAEAESLATRHLARIEADPRVDSLEIADALDLIGRARSGNVSRIGDADLARAGRCLGIRSRHAGQDRAALADAHLTLGVLLMMRGAREDSGLVHMRRALELRRSGASGQDTAIAEIWDRIGQCQNSRDDLRASLAAFDSSLTLHRRLHRENQIPAALVNARIGDIWFQIGRRDSARAALDSSLVIFERLGAHDSPERWLPLMAMSSVENADGDISRALDCLLEALRVLRLASRVDQYEGLLVSGNLALRLFVLGDAEGSRATAAPLLPVFEARFGRRHGYTATIRHALATTYAMAGDTVEAMRRFVDTESLLVVPGRPPSPHLVDALRWQAELLAGQGRLREARATCLRSIEAGRASSDPIQRGELLAASVEALMTIQAALGDTAALDSARRELAAIGEQYGLGPTAVGESILYSSARAARRLGREEDAWTEALEADQRTRERLRRNIQSLPDHRALELADHNSAHHDFVLELARDHPERLEPAWDRVVRMRGLVDGEIRRRRLPRELRSDDAAVGAHQRWLEAQRRYAQRLVSGAASARDSSTHAETEAMRLAAGESEREYAKELAAHQSKALAPEAGLADVLARLRSRQALVSFVETDATSDSARVSVFIARGGDARVERLELGRSADLRATIDPWFERLATSPRSGASNGEGAERECRRLGREVRARTWDRIARKIAGATEVFLVPAGPLQGLPWQALPEGTRGYLVESGPLLHLLNAERDLLAASSQPSSGGLLAVGNPDFQTPPGVSPGKPLAATGVRVSQGPCAGGLPVLTPLPESGREAKWVAARWLAGGQDARALLGAEAAEAAFKRLAPGRSVLHLATHGVVTSDTCADLESGARGVGGLSALAGGVRPAARPRPNQRPGSAKDPAGTSHSFWMGRRVWLALAGANRALEHHQDENEGLLTAEEVVTLDLQDAEWVVLSACHSGLAERWSREGAVGMRRAFHMAGARTVIAGQWSLDDQAAREWMEGLYAARMDGASAAAAITSANRRILTERRKAGRTTHPFYWAAFVPSGD